jgi:hypothetical protein
MCIRPRNSFDPSSERNKRLELVRGILVPLVNHLASVDAGFASYELLEAAHAIFESSRLYIQRLV